MAIEFITDLLTFLSTHIPNGRLGLWARHKPLFHAQIEHVGRGTHLRLQHHQVFIVLLHHAADLAVRIVQIANDPRATNARLYTGRQQAYIQTVRTEGALVGCLGVFVNETGIVRAGLHTIGTAHTHIVIHHHNAVLALEGRLYGANRHTRRVVAVVTQARQHERSNVAGFLMLHLVLGNNRTETAQRRLVLDMARHRTGLTANTRPQINQHGIALGGVAFTAWGLAVDAGRGKAA